MKHITFFFILACLAFASMLRAQQSVVQGYVYDEKGEPVQGAAIFWKGNSSGTVSLNNGFYRITKDNRQHELHALFTGYRENVQHVHSEIDTVSLDIYLQLTSVALDSLTVVKAQGRFSSRISPLNSEVITRHELVRAACCNLAESFETNPSVDVSYSDAITGARQIQLLGISGAYVQMLTENFPNFRGLAQNYGLDYIPGVWMQSIQVSKGASSVKNGYESVSGQVNVEYKKPDEADPFSLNLYANTDARLEANADGAIVLNKNLSTGIFAHYSQEQQQMDRNGDRFMDAPLRRQVNLMNRWKYVGAHLISQTALKYVFDQRTSGETDSYNSPYRIDSRTTRMEISTKNGYVFDAQKNNSLALILSWAGNSQKKEWGRGVSPDNAVDIKDNNFYASLLYETDFSPSHKISAGLSFNRDEAENSLFAIKQSENVSGAYFQYTLSLKEKLTALTGIRADYSSIYGWFVTPRIHLKYDVNSMGNLRLSAGRGARTAVYIPNEYSYLLGTGRTVQRLGPDLKQEQAWIFGISTQWNIPLGKEELQLQAEYYYTDFINQAVMDMETPGMVYIYNLQGKSYAHCAQIEASYTLFRGFTLMGAFRYNDTRTRYLHSQEPQKKPLMSDYKALLTSSYLTKLKKWQFDLTAQFNGGGRMPAPAVVAGKELWNATFKPYTVLNVQVTKNFRHFSLYAGGENLLNFRQQKPVINEQGIFDATMVYGPTQGIRGYIGFRYNIDKF